jgi:hypothetical protein
MWKEVVVAQFNHYLAFAWMDCNKSQKQLVKIAGLRAKIWTQDLPNKKQDLNKMLFVKFLDNYIQLKLKGLFRKIL